MKIEIFTNILLLTFFLKDPVSFEMRYVEGVNLKNCSIGGRLNFFLVTGEVMILSELLSDLPVLLIVVVVQGHSERMSKVKCL